MAIYHNLNSNGYLINNDIWMEIDTPIAVEYITLHIKRAGEGGGLRLRLYTYKGFVRFNLQPILKGLRFTGGFTFFLTPYGRSFPFELQIFPVDGNNNGVIINKTAIAGGRRVTNSVFPQTISPTDSLRISEKLPVWEGYPYADYSLDSRYVIAKVPISNIRDIDYRRKKGCNNIYLQFANQKGGYSFWLFESYKIKESTNNVGSIYSTDILRSFDLGQETKAELQVFSKIPQEYKAYVLDLIVSQDVLVYNPSTPAGYDVVHLKSNYFEFDSVKKVYNVSITFEMKYLFNPSSLW